ncbi:MAG: toxin [Gammaproteobacteria bacterium]|nr:MAG: toxin [Gammaproteobacteria bacterium]
MNTCNHTNKDKHGVDFENAKLLWLDSLLVEIPANTSDEARCIVIGQVFEKHWSAIITYRNGNVRIISVRRSRSEEVKIYES